MWYFAKPLRDLRSHPIRRFRDIRGDHVRISGTVHGTSRVVTPITGATCSLFDIELREWDNGVLFPFSREHRGTFRVVDGTGEAWIDTSNAAMALRVDDRGHSRDRRVAANLSAYVEDMGRTMADRWGGRRSLAWRECRLRPGDHVCVVGMAQREAHPAGQPLSYRRLPVRLVIHAQLIADRHACRCPQPTTNTVRDMRSPWQTK